MALRRRWVVAAAPLGGIVCALVALLGGAQPTNADPSPVVEMERWLQATDGTLRRVTVIVDTRLVDASALADARYPSAVDTPSVEAQFATFARWELADIPVPVQYADAHDPPGIAGKPQLVAAMATWNAVSGQDFRFADGGATSAETPDCVDNEGDGSNTVQFSSALPYGVLGETCTFFADEGFPDMDRIVEFDMHLDNASTDWSVAPQTPDDRYDLLSVVLHELGHAFGLDHSSDGTVMQLYLDSGSQFRVPTSDDIAGMRALYGTAPMPTPPPPTETPEPIPTPAATPVPGYLYRATLGSLSRD